MEEKFIHVNVTVNMSNNGIQSLSKKENTVNIITSLIIINNSVFTTPHSVCMNLPTYVSEVSKKIAKQNISWRRNKD